MRNLPTPASACRRHPTARFVVTCPGCAQELYDIEVANRKAAAAALAANVRALLGLTRYPAPRPDFGETETRVSMWDIRHLDAVFTHVGGTVTARQVERILSDGATTYTAVEVTVTVELAGIGEVQVFTDWDPADEPHGFGLPVIVASGKAPAAALELVTA